MKNQPVVYHNNICSKCHGVVDILKEQGFEPMVVDYINQPLSKMELEELIALLGIRAEELLRKSEDLFTEQYAGRELSETDAINAMLKFPVLMQRPVVVYNNWGIIARPPEKVLEII